jgi:hypothetical protein
LRLADGAFFHGSAGTQHRDSAHLGRDVAGTPSANFGHFHEEDVVRHLRTHQRAPALVLVAALSGGCWGSIADPGTTDRCGPVPLPPIKRLSHAEYANTIRDLFPGLDAELPELAADPTPFGFDNDADALRATSLLVDQYSVAAATVARQVRERADALVPCAPSDGASCGHAFLEDLAPRAYRRPVTAEELAQLTAIFDGYFAADGFDVALELVTQVILQAPPFLYRVEELAPGDRPDSYAVASRLSYLLWSTMPDEALFDAAAADQLATAEGITAEVDRMLADPRALDGFMNFARQWLNLARLDRANKLEVDGLDDTLRAALAEEAQRFLTEIIYARGGTLDDLLTSSRGFVGPETAAFYGLPAPADWEEVDLPDGRVGFLMQLQFLTAHGHPLNPSPVLRGLFVLQRLMCVELGSPPAGVDMSIPEGDPDMGPTTNRDNYDRATSGEVCSQCHTVINPVGFAFEHFDTMGRWRDQDNGLPVDDSASAQGVDLDGAAELAELLASSEQVDRCVTRKHMYYALAGTEAVNDACLTEDVSAAYAASGGSLRELMRSIALHPRFHGIPEQE